jgi:hypothetical protein
MSKKRQFELKAFQDLAFPVRVGGGESTGVLGSARVSSNGQNSQSLKKVTVILNGSDICFDNIIKGLKELKYMGTYITVVVSQAAEMLVDIDTFMKEIKPDRVVKEPYRDGIKNLITNTDLVIAPNLTQNTLSKTSLGIQDELPSMLLWQYLINGVPTVISTASVYHGWFDADLNTTMKRVLEGYVKTLVSFGASVEDSFNYARFIEAPATKSERVSFGGAPVSRPATPSVSGRPVTQRATTTRDKFPSLTLNSRGSVNSNTRVITESYVHSCGLSQIVVEKGIIVTPLAYDAAKALGIAIVRN